MEADQAGVDDMVELAEISDKAIAANLYVRLKQETIYTYIGRVLIAVNPFKALQIYGQDAVDFYRGAGDSTDSADEINVPEHDDRATRCTTAQMPADILENRRRSLQAPDLPSGNSQPSIFKNCKGPKPPHLYALTNTMYHNMMMEHENQCVIISGESGAGKTVSAKHIMNFIAKASAKGSEKVEHIKDIIIQSNPLLEAFGNAKTMRNNNSSRFGKFMEIQFNFSGHPDGGKVSNFLLEKSRVVHLNTNERNYHVFYQLLSGCPKEQHNDFGFEFARPEFYFYLNQTGVYTVDGTNDAQEYNDLMRAMSVVGFDSSTQTTILKLVSSILHLGNVQFNEDNNVAVPASDNMLTVPARLLSVNKDLLKEKLISSIMEARWGGKVEITKKTNNAGQALQARDALAKALYSQLFDYLVQGINDAMQKEKEEMSIGVLDIYGFEIFESNQFEQFAINFVNEKLQQIFIELTLKMEQEEYVQEGIKWQAVKYFDNKTVCELIESKRPPGIMSTLDDVCSTMHAVSEGSGKTLMEKLRAVVASNKDFSRYFRAQSNYFTITHYAGNVDYEAKGFCEKNKDVLSNDMIALMQSSEDAFVRDLFPVVASNESSGRRAKSNTAGAKIKSQAAALISKIMTCTPHYVRCIKPSESKKPLDWDDQRAVHQVKYLGLKENIRVRRAGFAFRRQFQHIIHRYGIISPQVHKGWDGDPAEGCRIVMNEAGINPSKWQAGKTKLFLKEPSTLNELEDVKNSILEKYCVTIQGTYRTYRLRKRFIKIRKGVAVIQKAYRRHRDRTALDKLITFKKLIKGVDVLGDKKKRRASWDKGFKGDYMDFQNNKSLQNVITDARVEFAAEVNKYSRDGKEQHRVLVLTTRCLYIIGQLKSKYKPGDVAFKVKRKLHMADINSVTVSPNDDSFFVLHAKEYDNIIECQILPEALNRLAIVFKLERNCELQLNVADNAEYHIKGGAIRHVRFSDKGTASLNVSPSKRTFIIAATIVHHLPEDEVSVPGLSGEGSSSIGLFVDKVARRLSHSYSVNVPDPKAFTAVAKAIFGPSGGGFQCKGVFVDLPAGSLTSQTKEVCIQLCKNKAEVVPLNDAETIISRVVELSPHGNPLSDHAALCLPLDDVSCDGFERYLRWTPTQSGEKANWKDVYASDTTNGSDEEQTSVELRQKKAKVNTKVFGIFCIISRDLNQKLEPQKENSTSDAIKAFNDNGSTINVLQRCPSTHATDSTHEDGTSSKKRLSIKANRSERSNSSSEKKRPRTSFFKAKSPPPPCPPAPSAGQSTSPPTPPASGTPPPPPPPPCPPASPPAPPPGQSTSPPAPPASGAPPPPPPPPPMPSSASSAPASGTDNSFAAMLQARQANITS